MGRGPSGSGYCPVIDLERASDLLHERVQSTIASCGRDDSWTLDETEFEELARALFAHQFTGCEPYRRFCEGRGVTPATLGGWHAIPPVPTEVFKGVDLFTFPADQATSVFMTSGTRSGVRGRHLLRTDATYLASLSAPFDRFLLNGMSGRPSVFVLAPRASEDRASSLSHMLQWAHDNRGGPGSRFFWSAEGPELLECAAALSGATSPVLLLSTARALQGLLESTDESWALPSGSVVMETGGPKRSGMEFERSEFHERLAVRLGVSVSAIVSEYGMTELGSQGYNPSLWRAGAVFSDQPKTLWTPISTSSPLGAEFGHFIPTTFAFFLRVNPACFASGTSVTSIQCSAC